MTKITLQLINNAKILHYLELQCNPRQSELTHELYKPYIDYLSHRYEKEGLRKLIEVNKLVRLSVTRYIAGDPYNPPFLKGDGKGLPLCLGPLRKLVKTKDKDFVRYVLSILSITKPLHLPTLVDLEPIVTPSKGIIPDDFPLFLKSQKRLPGGVIKLRTDNSDLSHLTTKSGPNGQALVSSLLDLKQMPERLAEVLFELAPRYMERILPLYQLTEKAIRQLITEIGGKFPKSVRLRKLTPIQDKEGKTRIIGIGDYFSQAVLRPVHDQLMKYLSRIEQDMTRNQRGHPKDFGDPMQRYHSLDLKNATDRFPISIQTMVMEFLSGDSKGSQLWKELMSGFPFDIKGDPVLYQAGQPMGLYSSWTAFAVTHHFVVQYSAWKVGKPEFSDYLLLGDDIVIRDDDVAQSYRSVLESLGVDISEAKTLVSYDTFEFAKKVYHKGEDISPIPGWSLILSKSSTELAGALADIFKYYQIEPYPESISSIVGMIVGNNKSRIKLLGAARRLVPLLVYFPISFEGIGKREINPEKLTKFLRIAFPGLPCWNVTTYENLLEVLVAETVSGKYIPELKEMVAKYDQSLKVMDMFINQDCFDQDPSTLSAIPLMDVLKRLSAELSVTFDKVMHEWIWENTNPIPFRNLGIVDPTKLTQDRQHLVLLGVRAEFTLGLVRFGRTLMKDSYLTPKQINLKWVNMVGELAESV